MNDPDPDPTADNDVCDHTGVRVTLAVDDGDAPDAAWIADRLQAACGVLRLVGPCLGVAIVDDRRMADLHERYSGVEGTTDVLTFDLRDDPLDERARIDRGEAIEGVEGEVVLCLDEARRRAAERGHGVERELLLYALHGTLHLIGYDDHDEAGFAAMHAREDAVLASIGVGAVFAPAGEHRP